MVGFSVVWFGQVVSVLGTGMTQFALTIWAWQVTGQATALALVGFCGFFPLVVMTPLAGALVDRWNRKLVMILSDLAAGLATIVVFVLLKMGHLEIWHLCAAAAFSGAFGAFQFPAYSASITLMLPKEQYTRANAMLGLAQSISGIFSPIAAGALLAFIGIGGILTIDMATFVFAIGALLVVPIPQPPAASMGRAKKQSLWADSLFGFRYVFARPSLAGILALFFMVNLLLSLSFAVLSPMILARTGNNELTLGSVQMVFGIAGVIGGTLVGIWGGPKRKIHGLLLGAMVSSLFGSLLLGVGRGLAVWGAGAFVTMVVVPMVQGSSQAIWQLKIPAHLQGRVFSARIVIGQIGGALALPIGGLLADHLFEPLMRGSSALARTMTPLVGSGPGSGMGLMFVLFGLLGTLVTVAGYLYRPVRNIETILPDVVPDHPVAPATQAARPPAE
jgi:MFS family permease